MPDIKDTARHEAPFSGTAQQRLHTDDRGEAELHQVISEQKQHPDILHGPASGSEADLENKRWGAGAVQQPSLLSAGSPVLLPGGPASGSEITRPSADDWQKYPDSHTRDTTSTLPSQPISNATNAEERPLVGSRPKTDDLRFNNRLRHEDGPIVEALKEKEAEKKEKVGAGAKIKGAGAVAAANIEHAADTVNESVKAGTGHLNAVDMLLHQHKETEHFIERIESNKDPKTRHRLLESMADNLASRMRVEEEIFYPAMAQEGLRSWDHVQQSVDEHNGVKKMITDLLVLEGTGAQFDESFGLLKQKLHIHVKEEKETFFPRVKEHVDSKKLKELGKEMHKRFSELMKEKHPRDLAFEDVGVPRPAKETSKSHHDKSHDKDHDKIHTKV